MDIKQAELNWIYTYVYGDVNAKIDDAYIGYTSYLGVAALMDYYSKDELSKEQAKWFRSTFCPKT